MRSVLFTEERRKLGGAVLSESSLEENENSGLWWLLIGLSCSGFSLAGLLLAREKSFFLLRNVE